MLVRAVKCLFKATPLCIDYCSTESTEHIDRWGGDDDDRVEATGGVGAGGGLTLRCSSCG